MLKEPYEEYMSKTCDVEFHDYPISDFNVDELFRFSENGVFTQGFDVTVKGKSEFYEVNIISSVARYESQNGEIPAVQIRIIDDAKDTLYYSPVYEIGHTREFYRREWRVPPIADRYDTVRISFIIPDGVKLYIKDFRMKRNYGYRERDIGIRYHGHGGCTSAFGFQMTAEVGFTSCITIPKFTKDGIGVCLHDDLTVINELRFDDGSVPEKGGKYDKPVSEFTYSELLQLAPWRKRSDIFAGMRVPTLDDFFRICSTTGMQPIFSVHPELTRDEWITVRDLLKKYRLLDQFRVKSNSVNTHRLCLEVFDSDIDGYILLYGFKDKLHPVELADKIGFDRNRHKVVVEYFNHLVTDEYIDYALEGGFPVSIAAMKGGISGPRMRALIDCGVTEFTVDHHCSMGLDW